MHLVNEVLTVNEVAERLRVTRQSVYRLLERGDLPSIKVLGAIRVRTADLDDYMTPKGAA